MDKSNIHYLRTLKLRFWKQVTKIKLYMRIGEKMKRKRDINMANGTRESKTFYSICYLILCTILWYANEGRITYKCENIW